MSRFVPTNEILVALKITNPDDTEVVPPFLRVCENSAPDSCQIVVGCALVAQLRAREHTWRDKHATWLIAARKSTGCHCEPGLAGAAIHPNSSWMAKKPAQRLGEGSLRSSS